MDDEQNLYVTRAYAQKQLLQEDLAIRIAEAINSAGALYEDMVFTDWTETQDIDPEKKGRINEIEIGMITTQDSILRRIWESQRKELEKELENAKKTVTREVNPTYYRMFIVDFYKLFLESKDQIRKGEVRNDIIMLFNEASYGIHNPRKALELFNQYLKTLEQVGILNFKYKTFRVGESFHEGIG